ncbi:MAG TPA: M18 family aminopeptidase [Gammaproteobacteria bacterium]|nr:M18 family aminopeptidase [Gammaproteobacteria bacterium]
MLKTDFDAGLLSFLDDSPTPFHAVAAARGLLEAAGFSALDERDAWRLAPGARRYVTRNGSALIAFVLGELPLAEAGVRMIGAHTDSPCLKIRPRPELKSQAYWQLGVEVYGGALLNPWFDRELGLAGRITLRDAEGRLRSRLVDLREPLAVVPSLAIHLDREANDKRSINKQTQLPAVIARVQGPEDAFDLREALHARLARDDPALAAASVLDYELAFYDLQPASLVGWRREFIASARLDNLLSCYTAVQALAHCASSANRLVVLNDHEEVGSGSAAGARGTFLHSVLERLAGGGEAQARAMARSLLVSTDNAHGVHPNYAEKHDANHGPALNGGPALKINHNQSYASNSETAAVFREACARAGVPLQVFVARGDMGCGSTIGPITATVLGVRTVDVGVPTLAMHSIRELAGRDDAWSLFQALGVCFELPLPD